MVGTGTEWNATDALDGGIIVGARHMIVHNVTASITDFALVFAQWQRRIRLLLLSHKRILAVANGMGGNHFITTLGLIPFRVRLRIHLRNIKHSIRDIK